jgi:hypothetical protein
MAHLWRRPEMVTVQPHRHDATHTIDPPPPGLQENPGLLQPSAAPARRRTTR